MYRKFGKRILDLMIAIPALIVLAPLLVVVSCLVRIKLGSPIIFSQQRPGLHGEPFRLFKFRTMTDARDESGALLPDHQRLTAFGRWLRSTSLDELPELWNVVRGEMSIIGPRPLLMKYLTLYSPRQAQRHHVRPGLTGWSQINGRNTLDWESKLELDAWYAEHLSLGLDLKVLWLTPLTVLRREGISAAEHATMPEFVGTRSDERETVSCS